MRRTMIIAAVATLGLLGACDNGAEPAPPPTSEDALTTATVAPTTPDEVEATTDAAPTTTEPTEQATATQTPDADGPPQMPDEATDQTEGGAEAFVRHYLETYNYSFAASEPDHMQDLATEECASCAGLLELIPTDPHPGVEYLVVGDLEAVSLGDAAKVTAAVTQTAFDGGDEVAGTTVFDLAWVDDSWIVNEIQVLQR